MSGYTASLCPVLLWWLQALLIALAMSPWITPAGPGVLGSPLAQGSRAAPAAPVLHPEGYVQASAAPWNAQVASDQSWRWKPPLGRVLQWPILLPDSGTRSDSLIERTTKSYPEKPFSLQIAGCWRLWQGSEVPVLWARGWMLLGAAGSPPGTSGLQPSPVSAKSGLPGRLIISLSSFSCQIL